MAIDLTIDELPSPKLQFGGATLNPDPKAGLETAGPFDLQFGATRKLSISVGIVGTKPMVDQARKWLDRCQREIPWAGMPSLLNRVYPSFKSAFHKTLQHSEGTNVIVDDAELQQLSEKMSSSERTKNFQRIVDVFASAHEQLAKRDSNRPDIVLVCLPKFVIAKARTVDRELTSDERRAISTVEKEGALKQLDLFDQNEEVEQTEEDLLRRDLRHALKARALGVRLPIQIVTPALIEDSEVNQDPATRAWNFSVGLYYKAGGVPWRLPTTKPETCFVGVSFNHFRTTKRHLVRSSLAQAFSSVGEGFAIRGEGLPVDPKQRRNTKLTEAQANVLGKSVLAEYVGRTGNTPLRMTIHKTSLFDEAEISGFTDAFRDIPIVNMVTLIPSNFRLLRFGAYPVNAGTVCTVNEDRTYLYTTGFIPALGTYPGPHIPQPFEVRCFGDYSPEDAVGDVFGLAKMNWNTADIRGKWPVTLSFARRVGGILDEYGDEAPPESSLRYFM